MIKYKCYNCTHIQDQSGTCAQCGIDEYMVEIEVEVDVVIESNDTVEKQDSENCWNCGVRLPSHPITECSKCNIPFQQFANVVPLSNKKSSSNRATL